MKQINLNYSPNFNNKHDRNWRLQDTQSPRLNRRKADAGSSPARFQDISVDQQSYQFFPGAAAYPLQKNYLNPTGIGKQENGTNGRVSVSSRDKLRSTEMD